MKSFLVAIQFLTIIPVNIGSGVEDKVFGRSLAWFPFVGMMIGLALSSLTLISSLVPQPVIAALILACSIIITGGIHLDGFADTCDGLFGFTDEKRALEIMRDSHIGVMAAAGVGILLILKFSLLSAIPIDALWKHLLLMTVFGRWAQVLSCTLSGYARQDGKARCFIEYATWRELLISGSFSLILFIALIGMKGLALFATSLLSVLCMLNYIKTKIGGMTGDTIGAINEAAEASILLFSLIFWRMKAW